MNGSIMSTDISLSILQFVSCAGNVAWSRYHKMYLLNQGLTVRDMAIMAPFSGIMKFLGYPFWSYMVDLTNNFKLIYTISASLSFIMLSLFFIDYTKYFIFNKYFILFNIIRCLRSFCNSSWVLIDSITMELIKDKSKYGQHRLFAALAWGICSLIVGYIIDYFGYNSILVYQFIGFISVVSLVNIFLPNKSNTQLKIMDQNEMSNEYITALKHRIIAIIKDTNFMVCIGLIFVYFSIFSIVDSITYFQFKQEFNAPDNYIGRIVFISTLSELPLFYFGEKILKRFQPNTILLFSHIILFIRLFCHGLIRTDNSLHYVYILQLLHGFCIALPNVTLRVYFHQKAVAYSSTNVNMSSSIQSIFGIVATMSGGVGVFLWSNVYSYYSALHVYYAACLLFVPSILFIAASFGNNIALFNQESASKQVTPESEYELQSETPLLRHSNSSDLKLRISRSPEFRRISGHR